MTAAGLKAGGIAPAFSASALRRGHAGARGSDRGPTLPGQFGLLDLVLPSAPNVVPDMHCIYVPQPTPAAPAAHPTPAGGARSAPQLVSSINAFNERPWQAAGRQERQQRRLNACLVGAYHVRGPAGVGSFGAVLWYWGCVDRNPWLQLFGVNVNAVQSVGQACRTAQRNLAPDQPQRCPPRAAQPVRR